jgi:flagellar basal body-associated protein FliL
MIRANDSGLASPPPPVIDEPPRRGLLTSRNIIILVGVIAWIAVLVLFIVPQLTRRQAAAPIATPAALISQQAAAGGVGSAPKAVPAPDLVMGSRVFNLSGATAGFKYVKLSVVVQFADDNGQFAKAKGDSLKKMEDQFAADNAGTIAAFNDIMTTVVSSKTAAELATPQGKENLRQELVTRFNQALAAGGSREHVTYVIFSDFVMQ